MPLLRGVSRVCRATASSNAVRNSLLLTLSSPASTLFAREPVESVTLPGTEGYFTLTNNHSQCVTQLKPGVVTVKFQSQDPQEFFMTDGFAILNHAEKGDGCCAAEVSAVEIVPTSYLDNDVASQLLAEVRSVTTFSDDWDKAKNTLARELLSSVVRVANAASTQKQ